MPLKLRLSIHAKNKLKRMKSRYRTYTKNLLKTIKIAEELYLDYVFEFYADRNNVIKKVCYRLPMKDLDYDLILVISSNGKVVTIYLNNNFTGNRALKRELYIQGEDIESETNT